MLVLGELDAPSSPDRRTGRGGARRWW
jgi:hypothetical protein